MTKHFSLKVIGVYLLYLLLFHFLVVVDGDDDGVDVVVNDVVVFVDDDVGVDDDDVFVDDDVVVGDDVDVDCCVVVFVFCVTKSKIDLLSFTEKLMTAF